MPDPVVTVSIAVAAAANGVIGRAGRLPWRMPSDLKRFRALTMGKPVIMGRKTFQSLPRPLDGRDNIVVTRDASFAAAGAIAQPSLAAALAVAREYAGLRGVDEIVVIGGAEIYAEALSEADLIYLTRIHAAPEGDAHFADPDPRQWEMVASERLPRGPADDHDATLLTFRRRRRRPIGACDPGLEEDRASGDNGSDNGGGQARASEL